MIRVEAAASTHVGRVREVNQDRALVSGQIVAVADGMGGHAGGDKAAALAIAELGGVRGAISAERLIKVVQAANQRIFKVASAPELRGMGTTIVAAVVDVEAELLSLVNVGDSRGYQLRDGCFSQVTEDHSLVEDLLRSGRLTEEEARVHPQRNIVTRVLGIGDDVDVDLFPVEVRPGDRYVLCSDGLTNEVDDEEILAILQRCRSSSEAADELVSAAVNNGGRDNVTVAVIDILGDAPEGATTKAAVIPETGLLESPLSEAPPLGTATADATATREALASQTVAPPVHPLSDVSPSVDRGSELGSGKPLNAGGPTPGSEEGAENEVGDGSRPILKAVLAAGTLLVGVLAVVLGSSWYADSSWFVEGVDGEVVIMQGRPGGFLWHDPEPIDPTGIAVDSLDGLSQELLLNRSSWSSVEDAEEFVRNLELVDKPNSGQNGG